MTAPTAQVQPKPSPKHSSAESPQPSKATHPNRNRMVAILHNAAMDLWDVATEDDAAQMWEEARAIASRILAACPST